MTIFSKNSRFLFFSFLLFSSEERGETCNVPNKKDIYSIYTNRFRCKGLKKEKKSKKEKKKKKEKGERKYRSEEGSLRRKNKRDKFFSGDSVCRLL